MTHSYLRIYNNTNIRIYYNKHYFLLTRHPQSSPRLVGHRWKINLGGARPVKWTEKTVSRSKAFRVNLMRIPPDVYVFIMFVSHI